MKCTGSQFCECRECEAIKHSMKSMNDWRIMETAPKDGWPIVHVRGKLEDGSIVEDMHFAEDLSGEEQPRFSGWFAPYGSGRDGYYEVEPVAWMPKEDNHKERR